MEKMLFIEKQPEVTVTVLPDGKRDVRILTNEEAVYPESHTGETTSDNTGDTEEKKTISEMYQYSGNQFRTIYPLTKEDILADKEKYFNYSPEDEPTQEEQQIITRYEETLMEKIKEVVNSDQ